MLCVCENAETIRVDTLPRLESQQCLSIQVCGSKHLSCHAGDGWPAKNHCPQSTAHNFEYSYSTALLNSGTEQEVDSTGKHY